MFLTLKKSLHFSTGEQNKTIVIFPKNLLSLIKENAGDIFET